MNRRASPGGPIASNSVLRLRARARAWGPRARAACPRRGTRPARVELLPLLAWWIPADRSSGRWRTTHRHEQAPVSDAREQVRPAQASGNRARLLRQACRPRRPALSAIGDHRGRMLRVDQQRAGESRTAGRARRAPAGTRRRRDALHRSPMPRARQRPRVAELHSSLASDGRRKPAYKRVSAFSIGPDVQELPLFAPCDLIRGARACTSGVATPRRPARPHHDS